ncbi:MAG: response regulator [Myxococcota bacterium]
MSEQIRVLIVEDVEDDAALLLRELARGGYQVAYERVERESAMREALQRETWDVVLSDYVMPQFSALDALAVLRASGKDVPFIIVSGTIGEETAVEALKAGAHDFLVKGRLARLIPAIEREMREAVVRRERREAEEEKQRLREQLMLSDRMVSIGTLAAGVAHEINNPLACVLANVELALKSVEQLPSSVRVGDLGAELQGELEDAREAANRVRTIVQDVKIFSRAEEDKRSALDVRRVLESSARMAWNEVRHRARLVKDFQEVPSVDASESRLGQVFLNLIVNAAQAIPEGKADQNEIRLSTSRAPDGRVSVEVRDSGAGMSPEVLSRLFTPFFTTKPAGVGTGLGLPICRRIVDSLGGEIRIDSEVGKGTTFTVLLPQGRRAFSAVAAVPVSVAAARRGRVLVVDDEPTIAKAIQRVLAKQHDVVITTWAKEALSRIAGGDRYDVILCDLMMPLMTGMEFHQELARLAPDQATRVIFLTGGAFTASARTFLENVQNTCVEKPFDPTTLRSVVNDRLG